MQEQVVNNLVVMESQPRGLMPSKNEWDQIKEIALMAVKSGMLPAAIKTPEAAAIIALKGRELGLPPMVAFSHIHVIQGRPTMSAEIMLAYVYKDHPGCVIDIVERSETRCEIHARRAEETKMTKFEWNLDRAKKMGLIGKDNWVKQPGTMMFWRTISEMKRAKFPEVLMGIDYSREELEDSGIRNVEPIAIPDTPPPAAQSVKKASAKPAPKNFAAPDALAETKARAVEPQFPPKEPVLTGPPGPVSTESEEENLGQSPAATVEQNQGPTFKEVYGECVTLCREVKWSPIRLGEFARQKLGKSLSDLQAENAVSQLCDLYNMLLQEVKEMGNKK